MVEALRGSALEVEVVEALEVEVVEALRGRGGRSSKR